MILSTAIAAILLHAQATPSIDDFVQPKLHDMKFTGQVLKGDQAELAKINKDFGLSYRFKTTYFDFKEPFKIRGEAVVEDTRLLYITNGAIQTLKVPRSNISSRSNLADKPGRRQTTLDFGVMTPSLFDGLFVDKFVRWDRETGDAVFDLTYNPNLKDTSRNRVWLDPQKRYVVKREWYNQFGRQLATFYYEEPKEYDGIWLPTRLTVRNVDNAVAGIVAYETIQVNVGLPDSLFE